MAELGEAALEAFKRHGRPILPIKAGAKFPPRKKWKSEDENGKTIYVGLDTEDSIRGWWSNNPSDNFAIITGGDLEVLDIDVKTAPINGFETLKAWGIPVPKTLVVETPSGGQHYYYKVPDGSSVRTFRAVKPGLDVKGEGGYVLGPGSICANGVYKIIDDRDLAVAPGVLLDNDLLSANVRDTLVKDANVRGRRQTRDMSEEWNKVYRVMLHDHMHIGRSLRKPDLPSFGESQRHNALLSCFGHLRNQSIWRSFEQWEAACEWVSDAITTPSFRVSATGDFRHLVNDVWALEDPPIPLRWPTPDERPVTTPKHQLWLSGTEREAVQFEWLLDGVLPLKTVTALYAPPKEGKSEFTLQLASAVQHGRRFLDLLTEQAIVLYATEEDESTFSAKLDKFEIGDGVKVLYSWRAHEHDINNLEAAVGEILRYVRDDLDNPLGLPVYAVIDTYSEWAGFEDENVSAEAIELLKVVRRTSQAEGIGSLILFHAGKSGDPSVSTSGESAIELKH